MRNTLMIATGARTLIATGNPVLIIAGGVALAAVLYATKK